MSRLTSKSETSSEQLNRTSSNSIFAGFRRLFQEHESSQNDVGLPQNSGFHSARPVSTPVSGATDHAAAYCISPYESQSSSITSLKSSAESSPSRATTIPTSPSTTPAPQHQMPVANQGRAVTYFPSLFGHMGTRTKRNESNSQPRAPIVPFPLYDEPSSVLSRLQEAGELLKRRHAAIESQKNAAMRLQKFKQPWADLMKKYKEKVKKPKKTAVQKENPTTVPRIHQYQPNRTGHRYRPGEEFLVDVQHRQRLVATAYNAFYGCSDAVDCLKKISKHLKVTQDASKAVNNSFTPNSDDIEFRFADVKNFDHRWIQRYNASRFAMKLHQRRVLNVDDYECIIEHLFPDDDTRLLSSENFEILLEAIREEGALTKAQVQMLAALCVMPEEIERGVQFTPPSISMRAQARDASNLRIFEMPQRLETRHLIFSGDNLHAYLRLLVEAAVYRQHYYRGYFLPNPVQKLGHFYKAFKLSQEHRLVPEHLADYQRRWTYAEGRLLERGHFICNLLEQYENGVITDFGIIRAIRGTFVHIDGQTRRSHAGLESFLYHRLPSTGSLSTAQIPEILALLPDNDNAFASPCLRKKMMSKMEENARIFQAEERERLAEIRASRKAFEQARKKELGIWGRVQRKSHVIKQKLAAAVGLRNEVSEMPSFDPFASRHGSAVSNDMIDNCFYY